MEDVQTPAEGTIVEPAAQVEAPVVVDNTLSTPVVVAYKTQRGFLARMTPQHYIVIAIIIVAITLFVVFTRQTSPGTIIVPTPVVQTTPTATPSAALQPVGKQSTSSAVPVGSTGAVLRYGPAH